MRLQGYRAGDRVYYRNCHGQQFYAVVLRTWTGADGRGLIVVKREEWPNEEAIDLDDYVMSRHFPRRATES